MGWLVLIWALAVGAGLVCTVYPLLADYPRAIRVQVMRNAVNRRDAVGFATASMLIFALGLFALLGGLDGSAALPSDVARPAQAMPDDLAKAIAKYRIHTPDGIALADLDKPETVHILLRAGQSPVPYSGRVGQFSALDGYWRLDRAVLKIGEAEQPIQVMTRQRSDWPETITVKTYHGGDPHDSLIEPEVKGYIDVSKLPQGKRLASNMVLHVSCPQYAGGKHFTNASHILQLPFSVVVLSEDDWKLYNEWSDYDRYVKTLSSRKAARWGFIVLGPLTLLSVLWLHLTARSLRLRMNEAMRAQTVTAPYG